MQCGQLGSRSACLSLMGAPSESRFRHSLNKLVNFKAANLLLQHVQHFFLNQSFKEKNPLVYSHKVMADELPCKRIRAQENGAM